MANPSDHAPVLVPVDFSPHSAAALLWASNFAQQAGAPLVVLHVVHDPAEDPGYYQRLQNPADKASELMQPLEEAANAAMTEFLHRFAQLHPERGNHGKLDTRLVVGVPATRILEMAEAISAQLIVMGSHGRTGLSHLLIGSKAEQVVRLSPIPVTIVKKPGVGHDSED